MRIQLTVNGAKRGFDVEPNTLLLNLLRDEMSLTGTKYGCGIGECGACTVLLDGEAVLACMILAVDADGRRVDTIEGLADGGEPHPIQQAYLDEGAVQCGYCTPGMILSAKALLDRNPDPSTDDIRHALRGNFCRCTGYVGIFSAVKAAARKMRAAGKP